MPTRENPESRWRDELDSFSRQHEGWIVRVAITNAAGRSKTQAQGLRLHGVTTDAPYRGAIAIMVGERSDDHVTHEVSQPIQIAIDQTPAGAERALRIRSKDGSTTTIEFRAPMRPEEVDGIAGTKMRN